MAYTNNPFLPKTRRLAVNEVVFKNKPVAEVARKYGIHRATLYRWIKKADPDGESPVNTLSSKPKTHPNQIPKDVVNKVIEVRSVKNRCAEIVQHQLKKEGIKISKSSINRIIKGNGLIKKPNHRRDPDTKFKRPKVSTPGDLVEMDTIHYVKGNYKRFYLYTSIDLYSRFAYVEYSARISPIKTLQIVSSMRVYYPFTVKTLQTDNGVEFGEKLKFGLNKEHIRLRRIRVGRPNDNAHIERFNRTIQEECFSGTLPKPETIADQISEYLQYYNYERPHLALNCLTPSQYLSHRS